MKIATGKEFAAAVERPVGAPTSHAIASGEGWSVSEFVCRLGPKDPRFEESHKDFAISAVVEGSFHYRGTAGKALLYPGAFMLGNAGTCYECGHDHGSGDRCIAFHYEPWFFEEIAASAAGSSRFRFPAAMLPALRKLVAPVAEVEATARGVSRAATEELAIRLAEHVLAATSGIGESAAAPAPKDQRRINNVVRYIAEHAEQPLDLAALAAMAFMSKYHFLRTFRRTVGVTPHQFLLGVRLRRAALKLRTTTTPIATIAFQSGFGDLSTFHRYFREIFGAAPGAFRGAGTSVESR